MLFYPRLPSYQGIGFVCFNSARHVSHLSGVRFAMEVEGVYYIAQVKQKKQAWKMYKEAVERNQTAGHIDVEVRNKIEGPGPALTLILH